ncbi:MAG TPA: GAF domain-containing protein, partial [Polyangiaceae bacterium]
MATLRYFPPNREPELIAVHKPVTTLGRDLGNDVHLEEPDVADHHAQILFDGRDFQLEENSKRGEILINGKKKRRARLVNGDRIQLGSAQIGFSMFNEAASSDVSEGQTALESEVAGLRRLQSFSEKLMSSRSVDELLEALLDDVIALTGAGRGAVLLVDPSESEPRQPQVRALRHVQREAIVDASGNISDSIVRQVITTKRPVIVSDALTDTTFGKSESVIALKLSSVMCAPLVSQGDAIGALYVGNDEIKSLFNRKQLDLLMILAAQASLILQNAMLVSALRADKEKLSAELDKKHFGEIIGACPSMMEVFKKL